MRITFGCCYKLGVLFLGVLSIGALLFGVCNKVADFWELLFGPDVPAIRLG